MYGNSASDGRYIVSARRLISKRVTKALYFRKILKNESFEVSKKWASVKMFLFFLALFRLEWAKKALVQREWKLGVI